MMSSNGEKNIICGAQGEISRKPYKNKMENLVKEYVNDKEWLNLKKLVLDQVGQEQASSLILFAIDLCLHAGEAGIVRDIISACHQDIRLQVAGHLLNDTAGSLKRAKKLVSPNPSLSVGIEKHVSSLYLGHGSEIRSLYNNKKGKMTDKWSFYLDYYDEVLPPYKERVRRLLEIGIQNGGSLDVWLEYFPDLQVVVGSDVNPKCNELDYSDSRVNVVLGPAEDTSTFESITNISDSFDLIIDDGSHMSSDVINNFLLYFPVLNRSGIYIIEDMHCSYWKEFGGGLYKKDSAINFFKLITDVINQDHWSRIEGAGEFIKDMSGVSVPLDNSFVEHLGLIREISFSNSMVVIKKGANFNTLGKRVVAGDEGLLTGVDDYKHKFNGAYSYHMKFTHSEC